MRVPTPGRTKRRGDRAGGLQEQLAGGRDAAADDDVLGVEDVDGVGDADAEPLAEDAQRLQGVAVAGLRGGDDRLPVRRGRARGPSASRRAARGGALQRGRLRERAACAGAPPVRSAPTIMWPSSAAAPVAPR